MSAVSVKQKIVGVLEVCTYLVRCARTGEAVIIDPGGDEEQLAAWARQSGASVTCVLNTHGHGDHVAGNDALCGLLGVPCALHEADIAHFDLERRLTSEIHALRDGDSVPLGEHAIRVLHTPGHTPGGVCYLVDGQVFTGDTLFVGAVGRTDLQGSSLEQLLESIKTRLLPLPGDTVVWPGHDYGETRRSTIEQERAENPYLSDLIG